MTEGGEIETFKVLEVGGLKWCKEHVPRDGNDWTEGQILVVYYESMLLEDELSTGPSNLPMVTYLVTCRICCLL